MENTSVMPGKFQGKIHTLLPRLLTWIGAAILIIAFFLPYASATGEYRVYLENYSDHIYVEELSMTNGEAIGLSMLEYAGIYAAAAGIEATKAVSIICLVLIGLIGLFSVLTMLFAILKKPIALFVFNGLTFGAFRVLCWDFQDRGVLPSGRYDWGISYYLYAIGAAIVLAGIIYLLVTKIMGRKQTDTQSSSVGNGGEGDKMS